MVFNSLQFYLFFIVVTLLYFQLAHKFRWALLLLASCYFYMVFKPSYILILFVTIIVDYLAGIAIEKTDGTKRKLILILSIISNIGFLAYFKYANFMLENLNRIFQGSSDFSKLDIILPIGLSFHTFQALSYTIEVYRKNYPAEHHFGKYALYVMFYPQLVAGPIERPQNVLWQFSQPKFIDWLNIKQGLLRMCWGFFKKIVIADRLSIWVDSAFDFPESQNGLSMLLAAFAFSFEIYCDFSGYSDIALGAAKVMGFDLMENFNQPYFSKSISEFWRKWHISLSTWFRDYLYIPLGGNRGSKLKNYQNLLIVFTLSGLWHGAKWTFIIWGIIHGMMLVFAQIFDSITPKIDLKSPKLPFLSTFKSCFSILITFVLVSFTWIFFRANGLSNALSVINKISQINISDKILSPFNIVELGFCLFLIIFLLGVESKFRFNEAISWKKFGFLSSVLVLSTYFFGVFIKAQFIYFQF